MSTNHFNTPLARAMFSIAALALAGTAVAQDDPYECDDNYAPCGTPDQSGGGGCGGGGSILINNTDLGDTYQYADDYDDDGIEDPYDNCVWVANANQADDDGDQVGNNCDNCPAAVNLAQENLDGDQFGDMCDNDRDGDGVDDSLDACPLRPDPLQNDTDGDGDGDACDDDIDNDGIPNITDNCVMQYNPEQLDTDPGAFGDLCDDDDDGDGIRNTFDNCMTVTNNLQEDADYDDYGDACDADLDGDGIINDLDNCNAQHNPDQADDDRDGLGEVCDDRYCFVVFGDVDNCLDPTDPFTIYSPSMAAKTGEKIRLRLFANHSNQAVRYNFEITEAPNHSRAGIRNNIGEASVSTPYEYHYLADRPVLFTPDRPGSYRVHVTAELAFEDQVTGKKNATSEAWADLEVEGEATGGGCSSVPFGLGAWFLPLLALAVTRRRR